MVVSELALMLEVSVAARVADDLVTSGTARNHPSAMRTEDWC